MGCDIHAFVEYGRKRVDTYGNEEVYWQNFGSEFRLNRDYFMFGILSKGVRYDTPLSFEAKGLPEDINYVVQDNAYYFICDGTKEPGMVSLKKAKTYEKCGCKIIYHNNEPMYVENPDWHSHSWLTTEEYEKALEYRDSAKGEDGYGYEVSPVYKVLLSSMKQLEEYGYICRLVFWFDN